MSSKDLFVVSTPMGWIFTATGFLAKIVFTSGQFRLLTVTTERTSRNFTHSTVSLDRIIELVNRPSEPPVLRTLNGMSFNLLSQIEGHAVEIINQDSQTRIPNNTDFLDVNDKRRPQFRQIIAPGDYNVPQSSAVHAGEDWTALRAQDPIARIPLRYGSNLEIRFVFHHALRAVTLWRRQLEAARTHITGPFPEGLSISDIEDIAISTQGNKARQRLNIPVTNLFLGDIVVRKSDGEKFIVYDGRYDFDGFVYYIVSQGGYRFEISERVMDIYYDRSNPDQMLVRQFPLSDHYQRLIFASRSRRPANEYSGMLDDARRAMDNEAQELARQARVDEPDQGIPPPMVRSITGLTYEESIEHDRMLRGLPSSAEASRPSTPPPAGNNARYGLPAPPPAPKRNRTNSPQARSTRRRHDPSIDNYTTSDITDYAQAIRSLRNSRFQNQLTDQQQQARDFAVREARNISISSVPMTAEGPRWPTYTLGVMVGMVGPYLLIGGGRLDPQGAAAEGERYYDFVRTDGSLLRCTESEVPGRVGLLNPRQITSADTYRQQIYDFRLCLDLENVLVTQHEIITTSINEQFYEVGERQMLGRTFDGSDIRDDAADAEVQRVRQLLQDATKAAKKATAKKRKAADTKWFQDNWMAKLQQDQKRRGIAHMIKWRKNWKTATEIEELEKKAQDEDEYGGKTCIICFEPVNEPVDENGKVVGKPVQLNCGHCFHEKCIKETQLPKMRDNNTYAVPSDDTGILVIVDTLKCPICRRPTIDPSFGDGIYRLTNLRF